MRRSYGVFLGLLALVPGFAVGVTFAAAINLHYDFHPLYFVGTAIALALAWALGSRSLRGFALNPSLVRWLPPLIAVAWTGAFFVYAWRTYPDRATAARRYRAILRDVPVYPGVRFHAEETWGRYAGDFGDEGFLNPPTEFLTTWTWLPWQAVTVHDVASWYETHLSTAGWRMERDDPGDGSVELVGRRGGVGLEVDVQPRQRRVGGDLRSSVRDIAATAGP